MDENNRFKKILIIFLFLAVIGVCGYFIWVFFFKPILTTPIGQTPGATTTPAGLPTAGNGTGQISTTTTPGGIPSASTTGQTAAPVTPKGVVVNPLAKQTTVLSADPSLEPILSGDGKSLKFYDKKDNKFYKIDENGDKVLLSNQIFYNVDKINWSPDTNKAVLEYPDGSKTVYDFSTNKQVTLPKHWEDFNFSADSSKLVMKSIGTDVENRWLITANADGSQAQALEYIGANADTVIPSWSPNNQSVAMYTQGMDLNRQEVFFVGQNKENFKSTVVEGRGFQPLWSKTGGTLLYSVYSSETNSNPSLWIVDAQGDNIGNNRQQLDLQTWADKCTFATDKQIYCAVPNELQPGSGIVPDLAKNTQDTLYKIDLENGTKQQVAIPNGSYNISNLIVSGDQGKLFFTDATTNQIYKIDLK